MMHSGLPVADRPRRMHLPERPLSSYVRCVVDLLSRYVKDSLSRRRSSKVRLPSGVRVTVARCNHVAHPVTTTLGTGVLMRVTDPFFGNGGGGCTKFGSGSNGTL